MHKATLLNWFPTAFQKQHKGLKIYNKIQSALVITKWIFIYYNTNFLL